MKKTLFLLMLFYTSAILSQKDSILRKNVLINVGISISPQLIFLAALDAGPFINLEFHPFKSHAFSFYAGLEVRNKWFHLPIQSPGFNGNNLRTFFSANILLPLGAGYSFYKRGAPVLNSFFVVASPVYFAYKERVANEHFTNTVSNQSTYMIYGILWSNSKLNKKGRRVNSQFFIPVFSRHILENLRNMTLKFGWSF